MMLCWQSTKTVVEGFPFFYDDDKIVCFTLWFIFVVSWFDIVLLNRVYLYRRDSVCSYVVQVHGLYIPFKSKKVEWMKALLIYHIPSVSSSFRWVLTRIICRYIALLDYKSTKNFDE